MFIALSVVPDNRAEMVGKAGFEPASARFRTEDLAVRRLPLLCSVPVSYSGLASSDAATPSDSSALVGKLGFEPRLHASKAGGLPGYRISQWGGRSVTLRLLGGHNPALLLLSYDHRSVDDRLLCSPPRARRLMAGSCRGVDSPRCRQRISSRSGRREWGRTTCLHRVKVALSQMSYAPMVHHRGIEPRSRAV